MVAVETSVEKEKTKENNQHVETCGPDSVSQQSFSLIVLLGYRVKRDHKYLA